MSGRKFLIVLIKPSHYDGDGYVIQWRRSTIPSNSLASVYGLLAQCAEERVLGADVDIEIDVYDECNTIVDIPGISRPDQVRRQRLRGAGGRSVESVSPRARHWAPVSGAWHNGRCRRLPCLRMHGHAAGIAVGPEGSASAGHDPLRRRGRRSARRPAARYRRGRRPAGVQLLERHAGHGLRRNSGPSAFRRHESGRALHQLRRRARLPVPMQLLHDHQRPGAQVPLSNRRRRRGDRARQRSSGRNALFCHRRQFRPQPQLGADPRSPHRTARSPGLQDQAPAAGRHPLPSHSGLHREGGARRLQRRLYRPREHQSRVADGRQEAPKQDLGISRHAAGLAPRQGHDLGRLYPRLPHRHARNRSRATSRPSSANCRSTSSNSSS